MEWNDVVGDTLKKRNLNDQRYGLAIGFTKRIYAQESSFCSQEKK